MDLFATLPEDYLPERQWYAVFTRWQHEAKVAGWLDEQGFRVFYPTYQVTRLRWDRRVKLDVPLFPNYVFVHCRNEPGDRSRIMRTPGVWSIVTATERSSDIVAIPDDQIESVRKLLASGCNVKPLDKIVPITSGMRVRVHSGALKGVEGQVIRQGARNRLVITIDALKLHAQVEVPAGDLEPAA